MNFKKSREILIQTKIASFVSKKRKHNEINDSKQDSDHPQISVLDYGKLDKELGIEASWNVVLENEFAKPYFTKLRKFIDEERNRSCVYPIKQNVFSWANIDIKKTRVVVVGQDPYHNPNQAHGLCFSVLPNVSTPPSLINIYKEITNDIKDFSAPKHGYLKGWASQGVLLLNSVLTVRANEANSHKDKGWELFTDAVINYLNLKMSNLVFMLWGAYAQKKCEKIDDERHLILKAPHPSPLSASRGFFGCKHFSKANCFLQQNGYPPIDWSYLPTHI